MSKNGKQTKPKQTYETTIKVKLTEAEREARKGEHVRVGGELEMAEANKRAELAEHNALIKELRQRMRALRQAVVSGEEEQTVEVFDRADERRGCVETVRLDTNEVLGERPMTADERQAGLFEDADDDNAGGKPGGKANGARKARGKGKLAAVPPAEG